MTDTTCGCGNPETFRDIHIGTPFQIGKIKYHKIAYSTARRDSDGMYFLIAQDREIEVIKETHET